MNELMYSIGKIVINFSLMLLFLRFMVQWADIKSSNPTAKMIYRWTGVVDMMSGGGLSKFAKGRISIAALVLMLVLTWLSFALEIRMGEWAVRNDTPLVIFFKGTLQAILNFLAMLRYTIIASIVVSWIVMLGNVSHSLWFLIMQLSEPITAPFRRLLPSLGMIDLSPLVALLLLHLLESFIGIIGVNMLQ